MKKLRNEQKGLIFIALIIILVLVLSMFFVHSLKTNKVEEALEYDTLLRILFVVEDEDEDALFSNVIIYDTSTKKAAVINLPGYTGAIYQSLGGTDRLDEVYNELGIEYYRTEVQKMLGITIPYTSVIKLDNFIKLCDMFGGMRVFIPSPVDCMSQTGERWLLPSGAVNLDGDKIAVYLRYREEDETEESIQDRYQNVMGAFLTGLHDMSFKIFNKEQNFRMYADCIQTNLADYEEETLYLQISEIDTESIIKQTITGSLRNVELRSGETQQLLFPLNNSEFIKEAVKQTTYMLMSTDGTLSNRIYVLEIQNGTKTQGLARRTATLYQNASYDVLSAVNADSNDYAQTVIIDHIGNEAVAKQVGELIRCTNIMAAADMEEGSPSDSMVDFTVILGRDFNGAYVIPGASY
ncbi:MAG: LCP family protein [Treponema sp.]|nr:LCP family protein [Treponema sp.]